MNLRLLIALFAALHANALHDGSEKADDYANEWIVRLQSGSVEDLAAQLGYENLGQVDGFRDYYLLKKLDHPESNIEGSYLHTRGLEDDVQVVFAQQLFLKTRVKREFLADQIERGVEPQLLELWDAVEGAKGGESASYFSDPFWRHQWYMNEGGWPNAGSESTLRAKPASLHVLDCFKLGYTGKGVRITVLDDGLEYTHDDIFANYDPEISWDYNNGTLGDNDPSPRRPATQYDNPNSHGTRCAGEIAMVPGNNICGVGIAYGAKVGAIRMLDGKIDDRVEGLSLHHAITKVDIYTASWGPTDDGKTVEGPGHLATEALRDGITNGRGGKGTIYVWASGNGGVYKDNCNCDGYTSNIFTISIGSVTSQGKFPWYGEKCSSTMAVAYSSGDTNEPKVATTDVNNECTTGHTGTSASAPLAAGIFALVLEANKNLTWRDMQHLVAHTSDSESLEQNGWFMNEAGFKYSHTFGFGVLNALRLVEAAETWINVGEQHKCEFDLQITSRKLNVGDMLEFPVMIQCPDINFLEHVQLTASISASLRGQLEVVLKSPSGDFSQLLSKRPEDESSAGFKNWQFNTVHFWGTGSSGEYKILIGYAVGDKMSSNEKVKAKDAMVQSLKLTLYGTKERPSYRSDSKKGYRGNEWEPNEDVESFLKVLDNIERKSEEAAEPSNKSIWDFLLGYY